MDINKTVNKALNEQINKEFYSAYLYLSMAGKCEEMGYPGFSNWMKKQAQEEVEHAMKIFNYVNSRNGTVELEEIKKPLGSWKQPSDMFKDSLDHEKFVTQSIHDVFSLARKENDIATESFLKWFVDEQVEEEESVSEVLDKLDKIKDHSAGLVMLDKQLAKR